MRLCKQSLLITCEVPARDEAACVHMKQEMRRKEEEEEVCGKDVAMYLSSSFSLSHLQVESSILT